MKIILIHLILLFIVVLIKSNNAHEESTIGIEVENSKVSIINEMEGQCYAYCFNIIQPVLEHTVSIQEKEKQIQEQSIVLKNLEKLLADLRVKVGIYEETIKNKDLQLAEHLVTSEKYKNETIEKNNLIMSKDELQSQMKEKLIEYKVKAENCLSPSCIGKLNDIYEIKVPGMESFSVSCDSKVDGLGWTVIQRRMDGSVDFNRTWSEYKEGFGNLRGEFFIGLEKLHLLTQSQPHELYIILKDFENETRFARYRDFVIGNEEEFYELKTLGEYSGDAGDSMEGHKDVKFSTPDMNHDIQANSCAKSFSSGWWFKDCFHCNLNGPYVYKDTGSEFSVIEWRGWKKDRPLKFTQMMIKPKSY